MDMDNQQDVTDNSDTQPTEKVTSSAIIDEQKQPAGQTASDREVGVVDESKRVGEVDEDAEDTDSELDLESDEEEYKGIVYQKFSDAPLNPAIVNVLTELNWLQPTPIQSRCLPFSLQGRDVAGFAQTGTGKTGVFLVTLAHRWFASTRSKEEPAKRKPFAVVIAPTRELAIQIEEDGKNFFEKIGIRSASVFGGADWDKQAEKLKAGVDVILATPGRLRDYHKNEIIDFSGIELFVCDEVDRMFDMGFLEDVEYFLSKLPAGNVQKLIFSATTSDRVEELTYQYLSNPEYISINSDDVAPNSIDQHAYIVETSEKFKLLLSLIKQNGDDQRSIIFANTKLAAAWIESKLRGNGIEADIITGDLPQAKRIKLIKKVKEGKSQLLIATDVASRGIHISGLTHVYNFDVPDEAANYVHRIGRTARAGAKGTSYVLVCDEYGENYIYIQKLLGKDAPAPKWPHQSLLEIEDKADNPYSGALGKALNSRPGMDRDRDRGGNRPGGRRFGNDRDNRRGGSDHRFSQDRNRPGRDRDRNRDRDRDRDFERGGQRVERADQNRSRSAGHNKSDRALSAKAKESTGFFGLLKKLFGLIFGNKAKKNNSAEMANKHEKRNFNRNRQTQGRDSRKRHHGGQNRGQFQGNSKRNHGSGRGHHQKSNKRPPKKRS